MLKGGWVEFFQTAQTRQIYSFNDGCVLERVINMFNYKAHLCNPEGGTLPEDAGSWRERTGKRPSLPQTVICLSTALRLSSDELETRWTSV